jgi:TonB-linked SusC/RagA family outer membrane protein
MFVLSSLIRRKHMSIYGRNRAMLIAGAALALVGAGVAPVVAQQGGTVQGTVVDASTGRGLAGVEVVVTGTNVRGTTNNEGTYRLTGVPAGTRTITATRVGYGAGNQTVTVAAGGAATANFRLSAAAVELEGLVVTALGITERQRTIGTAVQKVSGETLAEARETNIVNALSGKVAGVAVTNAGPQGGSSRIVIRGASSIAGNNQPLFVVDGVPIDNSFPSNGINRASPDRTGYGGVDYGNAAQDINPNDIESISILKGPNAAALYGSRAGNGAIVITTKSGKGARGLGITATSNVTFETPLRLPDYQNEYGQGAKGEFAFVNGRGGGVNDGVDESWGPKLDGRLIPQFNSPVVNGARQATPWVANPNNVRDFFETGRTLTNNVALTGSSDNANIRLSVTHMDQNGMTPSFGQEMLTTMLNGGARLTDKLNADANMQYITREGIGRPGTGYNGNNPMQQFIWFGRQVDINTLREQRRDENGNHYNWNYNYHNNPYWLAFENVNSDERDRFIGSGSVNYQFTDWLSVTGRAGTDWYRDWRKRTYSAGSIALTAEPERLSFGQGGFFEDLIYNQQTQAQFLVSANRDLTSAVALSVNLGGSRNDRTNRYNNEGTNQLVVPGVYNVSNSAIKPYVTAFMEERRINSLYGSAQFGFNDYLYVDVTGRNDWSSTLPEGNNSYFYPSVSTSFIFTDAFAASLPSAISFGKLRASWARVGSDTDPYRTAAIYSPPASGQFGSIPRFTVPNTLPNQNLKPEETTSWELGTELRFAADRLGVDLTFYDQVTRNQILAVDVSPTTGFTNQVLNAGAIANRGVELALNAIPVRLNNGFEWNTTLNFARNRNEVTELYPGVDAISLNGIGYWGLTVEARKGEPYGALYGNPLNRNERGELILTNGLPTSSSEKKVLGHYSPDWTVGFSNGFRFGPAEFSFLIDHKQGGDIFSVTHMFGRYAGVLQETVEGREDGLIIPGVNPDGTPNTTRVSAEAYNHSFYYARHEPSIFDATYTKLREVKLGYSVPSSFSQRLGMSGLDVSLVGRNLFLRTDVPHIDPETAFSAGNAQGLEAMQLPSARSIGLNVTVRP